MIIILDLAIVSVLAGLGAGLGDVFAIAGVFPNLLFVYCFCRAVYSRQSSLAVLFLIAGLYSDFFRSSVVGANALGFSFLAFLISSLKKYFILLQDPGWKTLLFGFGGALLLQKIFFLLFTRVVYMLGFQSIAGSWQSFFKDLTVEYLFSLPLLAVFWRLAGWVENLATKRRLFL